jgi:hypothetical protein
LTEYLRGLERRNILDFTLHQRSPVIVRFIKENKKSSNEKDNIDCDRYYTTRIEPSDLVIVYLPEAGWNYIQTLHNFSINDENGSDKQIIGFLNPLQLALLMGSSNTVSCLIPYYSRLEEQKPLIEEIDIFQSLGFNNLHLGVLRGKVGTVSQYIRSFYRLQSFTNIMTSERTRLLKFIPENICELTNNHVSMSECVNSVDHKRNKLHILLNSKDKFGRNPAELAKYLGLVKL